LIRPCCGIKAPGLKPKTRFEIEYKTVEKWEKAAPASPTGRQFCKKAAEQKYV